MHSCNSEPINNSVVLEFLATDPEVPGSIPGPTSQHREDNLGAT
jgi:hypothetical protein